jgi:hypothetical protein
LASRAAIVSLAAATSACRAHVEVRSTPDRPPLPHLHRDSAHPCLICTRTGLTPPISPPGMGSSRDWAHPGTGLATATSAPGLGSPPVTSAPVFAAP